jgi:hypothetical protein
LKKISKINNVNCNEEIEELKEIFEIKNNTENVYIEPNNYLKEP